MKKLFVAICAFVLLVLLCTCSSNKTRGEKIYQEFYDCGLFLNNDDGSMSLNTAAAKDYIDGMRYDWELDDCIEDINAYLKSIGKYPLNN